MRRRGHGVDREADCYTGAPRFRSPALPPALPPLHEIEDASRALGLGVGASELHGSLCGWLAGGGDMTPKWLGRLLADEGQPDVVEGSALDRLAKASQAQFDDGNFGFALLLPEGDADIAERSGALFEWCRGFLGAFGLAAGSAPPLSDEGREALADIARLASASPQEDGDEEDEAALVEIEEFVRVATLLLHGDCALGPRHRNTLN